MKGIVFTEFLEMVEAAHGIDLAYELQELPGLASGGVFTAIGTYDVEDFLIMLELLTERLGTSMDDLMKGYGEHLFGRFVVLFPDLFLGKTDSLAFLASIEQTIHAEVLKLYPEAELPFFDLAYEGETLVMTYSSKRPMASFAEGLMDGCLLYFGDNRTFTREDLDGQDGTRAVFRVR